MEAGELDGQHLDLIDAMIKSADESVSDEEVSKIENRACPTCGCCSGMFTANSMNCLNDRTGSPRKRNDCGDPCQPYPIVQRCCETDCRKYL